MAMQDDFEPGYEPVVSIGHGERELGRVGRGRGGLRLELENDLALSFDAEGRLVSAHAGSIGYRRTLDNRLLVTRHVGSGEDRRWTRGEEPDQPLELLAQWHARARTLSDALAQGGRAHLLRGAQHQVGSWLSRELARIARWTSARLREDTDRLRRIYLPIPILPPDQYASIVLQATEGCSFNRCTFCNFYQSIPYRERSLQEFRAHLDAVLEHLGRSVQSYHRVFLGQANALLVDTHRLTQLLEAIHQRLPMRPAGLDASSLRAWRAERTVWIDGVYAFIDSFHRPKSVPDLKLLHEMGLRRVYLGLETGCPRLLHVLGKPGSIDAAVSLAENLHEAEVQLAVIVLVGAGGRTHEESHVESTVETIGKMGLRRGDQVYLSKLVIHEGGAYQDTAQRQGLAPLSDGELASQAETFRSRLRAVVGPRVPVAPYDIDISRSLFTRG